MLSASQRVPANDLNIHENSVNADPIADTNSQNNREVPHPSYYVARDVDPTMFNNPPGGYHHEVNYGGQSNQALGGSKIKHLEDSTIRHLRGSMFLFETLMKIWLPNSLKS